MFKEEHWINICQLVADKCLDIFPEIKRKKLKSEILSHLFETQSEKYFNSIGIQTSCCATDKDPDLFFIESNKPCEIKVTGIDHSFTKKCKWMGGKYSKRTSDYIFIIWNCNKDTDNKISFCVIKTFVDESEWTTIDSSTKPNYYATVFESSSLLKKEHKFLVGEYDGSNFILCEYVKNARFI
jgi:hypothetical protein